MEEFIPEMTPCVPQAINKICTINLYFLLTIITFIINLLVSPNLLSLGRLRVLLYDRNIIQKGLHFLGKNIYYKNKLNGTEEIHVIRVC